ncbi:porin, partial [Salmonella enterica]
NNNAGRTVSALGQYDAGAFSGALAYTDIKSSSGASATRIYGGGARYQIGAFTPFGVITQVKNTDTNAKATTYELGTVYALTPLWD